MQIFGLLAILILTLTTDLVASGVFDPAITSRKGNEINNLIFETVSDAAEWSIPAAGDTTKIQLGLRITNRSDMPFRVTDFDTLKLSLRHRNGTTLPINGGRDRTLQPGLDNSPMLSPGKEVLFNLDAGLYWYNGILRLGGSDGYGGLWYFDGIKPGEYEFQIGYIQDRDHLMLGTDEARALSGYWIGEAGGTAVSVTVARP